MTYDGIYHHSPGTLTRGAVLDVGLRCVHSCKFCYYSYLDGSSEQFQGMRKASFRSFEECKEILRLLKQHGFLNFDVTGGEPTIHPDIVELMRYAHQDLGLAGRIITLGQFLLGKMPGGRGERLIDDLLDAGLVNFLFSLHAVEEDLFHRLTGASFARLQAAMNYLDERGFQYTSNTTVVEWNYRHLPEIAREILRHEIYLHNFIVMNAYYQWNQDGKAFGVQARYSEIHPYLKEAVAILESGGVAVNIRYAPLCTLRGLEKNLVGVMGVRYDPYEWGNFGGHLGGPPEHCAQPVVMDENGIELDFAYSPLNHQYPNGVRVTGMRGEHRKQFSEPCSGCTAREVCDGIDPNYLRAHGSSEFHPYEDAVEVPPLQRARLEYSMPFKVKVEPDSDMKALARTLSTTNHAPGVSEFLASKVVPVELPNRRAFNLVLFDPDGARLEKALEAFLEAFCEQDDVALHLLAGSKVEQCQDRVLAFLDARRLDPERIPDLSILDAPLDPAQLPAFLKAGELAIGSPALAEGARAFGIRAISEPSAAELRDAYQRRSL